MSQTHRFIEIELLAVMTPWKSEALKKQLEEETGNLLRWEADEEVANKELDAKLKQAEEVKAAQRDELEAVEKENERLQRRVAVAAQKKEEVQRKALFTQRKAQVLLDRFNVVTADVERLQSTQPCVEVGLACANFRKYWRVTLYARFFLRYNALQWLCIVSVSL